MPNKILVRNDGAQLTWKNSGGSYALTLTSLATNAAREGAKGDLGAAQPARWALTFEWEMTAAAVAGAVIEIWWAASASATAANDNDGGAVVTGADAAWAPTGGVDDCKSALLYVGGAVCSDTTSTNRQRTTFIFTPPKRYGMPIVVNKTAQSLSATAANSFITLTPLEDEIQ